MIDISVVIPSYCSLGTIENTLQSLKKQQSINLLKEIIVVDSSEDTETQKAMLRYQSELIQIVQLFQKTVPGIARNIGAERAKGVIVAFIDSDSYADENWLKQIAVAYREGCRVGGGAILLPDIQRDKALPLAQYFLQVSEFQPYGVRRKVKFSSSCNLFCDRELFKKIGGFPEIRASEDVLFGLKASEISTYYFDPKIQVYHSFSEEKQRFYEYQKLLGKHIIFYRRLYYKNQLIYKGVIPLILLPFFIGIKFFRVMVRIIKGNDKHYIFSFFRHINLIIGGLVCWAVGFAKGSLEKAPGVFANKVNICDVQINNVSMAEAIEEIENLIEKKDPQYVVTPNVDHIVKLQKDPKLRQIYRGASLVLADGVPLLWAGQFLGTPFKEKVSGSDLFIALCERAAARGYKLFFLGALSGVAQKAQEKLEHKYIGIKIVGTYAPPFGFESNPEEKAKIEQMIREKTPDILFVGLGTPKQEVWIYQNYKKLAVPVSLGIGASFDFVAGTVKRAPKWMQKVGLEWFWRLWVEPARLWRRYLCDDPLFFGLIFKQKFYQFRADKDRVTT